MSILRDYYEVDFEQFWKDDVLAHEENCFSKNAPQVALGLTMGNQCAFAELGEDGPAWGYVPRARRIEINKRYNDKAEKIVGKRLLQEEFPPEDASFPKCKEFGEIFGAAYKSDGNYTWMTTGPTTLSALEKSWTKSRRSISARLFSPKTGRKKSAASSRPMVFVPRFSANFVDRRHLRCNSMAL